MQVLVRHDDHIQGSERLIELVTAAVEGGLERFGEHITTVEVHLADENGPKIAGDDIRCTVEVRFEGHQPIAVTHKAKDLEVAVDEAVDKVSRMLDHQLGRIRDRAAAH